MKVNYEKLLANKILIFIDKVFRFFGHCIVLNCNTETKICTHFYIKKK